MKKLISHYIKILIIYNYIYRLHINLLLITLLQYQKE